MHVPRSKWPAPVILVSIVGGISTCSYGLVQRGLSGFSFTGCDSGGCEERVARETASADTWLAIGVFGGLTLLALGLFGRYLDRLRARAAAEAAPELTEARVVPPGRRRSNDAAP